MRNSKALDLMRILKKNHYLFFHDPYVDKLSGFKFIDLIKSNDKYDIIILCVPHKYYMQKSNDFLFMLKEKGIFLI